jgi:two-component system, LytTR family, response regulator
MTRIRTLIVDDEPIARARVLSLLLEEPDVDVVGECAGGSQAVSFIRSQSPDLVFLDIQMPEMDGFEVARALQPERMPALVFVTAFDQYALRAFECHALDYLLKPFSAQRFKSALSHARQQLAQRQATTLGRQLLEILPEMRSREPVRDRLVVRSSGRVYFVRIADIDWCEAAGNYVALHVGQQSHLTRETMSRLESQLDQRFVRIHRSTIVNVDRVQELRSSFNGEHVLLLRDGTRLTLSRGYRDALQARLGTLMANG